MSSIIESLGGRKFGACLVALATMIVFFALGKLDQAAFVDTLKWVVGLYLAGNVGSDIAAIFVKPQPPTPPPSA